MGGLKSVGTYTFDGNPAWVVSGDDTEFNIPLVISNDKEEAFEAMSFKPSKTKAGGISLTLTDGGLYLIPQTATGQVVKDGGYKIEGAYAELDAQVCQFGDPDQMGPEDMCVYYCAADDGIIAFSPDASIEAGFGLLRVPLNFTLLPGRGYALTLDLSRAVIVSSGEPAFAGAKLETAG